MSPAPSAAPTGETWRILGLLGRGTFGEVLEAEYRGPDGFRRVVAIKTLRPELEQEREHGRRLRDEARLLGLLRHPAVVAVERTVRLGGRWGFVMERVDGLSLSALAAAEPVPVGAALHIAAEIAGALRYCASAPGPDGRPMALLHRDIKPGNVLVTATGQVKVLDFGVAHAVFAGRESETGSLIFGSPGYMAPERFELREGPASDLYATGVLLYELLAGQRLGRASTDAARHGSRIGGALARLREARAEVPAGVLAILQDLLHHDPERRGDAASLRARCLGLLPGLEGEPFALWAERAVPAARDEMTTLIPASWGGAPLMDEASPPLAVAVAPDAAEAPVEAPPSATRPQSRRWLVGLLLLLLGLCSLVLVTRPASSPTLRAPVVEARPSPASPASGATEPTAPVPPPSPPPRASRPTRTTEPRPARSTPPSPSPAAPALAPPEIQSCAVGEVRLVGAAELRYREVGGPWLSLPDCVDARSHRIVEIGRATGDEVQPIDELSLDDEGWGVRVACDDRRCSADYQG